MNPAERPWTDEEIDLLYELRRAIPPTTWPEIGRRLGRSEHAARGRYERQNRRESAPPKLDRYIPQSISGNDDLHLERIAKANNGKGFPFLILPAAYRVAA